MERTTHQRPLHLRVEEAIETGAVKIRGLLREEASKISDLLLDCGAEVQVSLRLDLENGGLNGIKTVSHLAYSLGKQKLDTDPVWVGAARPATPDLFEGQEQEKDLGKQVVALTTEKIRRQMNQANAHAPEEAEEADDDPEDFCDTNEPPSPRYMYNAPEGRVALIVECRKSKWATYYTNPEDMVPKRLNTPNLPQRDDRYTAGLDLRRFAEEHGLEAVEEDDRI